MFKPSQSDPYGLFLSMEKRREETAPKVEEELRILRREAAVKAKNPHENAYMRPSYLGNYHP